MLSLCRNTVFSSACYARLVRNEGCETFVSSFVVSAEVVATPLSELNEGFSSGVNFSVFPNPANEEVSLIIKADFSGQTGLLTIQNMHGKEIHRSSVRLDNNKPIKLNTSGFSKGIYNIYLKRDGSEKGTNQKLIINR